MTVDTRRALVTGVSRGIGRAVAEMLLAEGWDVFGVSRSAPKIAHEQFRWFCLDVSKPWEVGRLDWFLTDPLDALVHCAAIRPEGRLDEMNPREWRRVIQVNLIGTHTVVHALLPFLKRSDDGRVLLFSGGGAFAPSAGFSAYASAKAGVVSLMETLADELRHSTVTVNCVAPGYVPTTMHENPVPDRGEAMAEAVACVRHLLGPQTRGLSGKTISAPHDDWRHIGPLTVARVNASMMGTRKRQPIAMVGRLANLGERAVVR
jgi:NAD(P)-dependent dehydrogenase (short-subunit alcohol dehydrogenase family)